MSTVLLAVLLLSATPNEAVGTPAVVQQSPNARVEKLLATPRTGKELEDATHAALRRWAHPSNKDAGAAAREFIVLYKELQSDKQIAKPDRDQLRLKVRGRLTQLAAMIDAKSAKQQPATVAKIGNPQGILAQQAPAAAQGGGMGAGFGGGPNNNADDDNGPALVELIQTTISPASWDVNGGPGTVYYWRPQRALVISAGQDEQDAIGEVLEQLEEMGR
jgi:hypothetical protein